MTRTLVLLSRMAASLAITGCGMGGPAHLSPHGDEGGRQNAPNPLFSKSPLQYEAPDYAAIKRSHFRPAFERGMKEQADRQRKFKLRFRRCPITRDSVKQRVSPRGGTFQRQELGS